MTTAMQDVLAKAVGLPPVERAGLVEGILSSFDFPARPKVDAAWAREVEERIDAYDCGKIAAISATAVFERIEKKHSL